MEEPTAEALMENLLQFAIDTEDIHAVQQLLKTGLNSNNHVYNKGSIRVTPLQCACELHGVKIVAFLVKEEVDVNKTLAGELVLLSIFDSYGEAGEDDDIDIICILLDAGAEPNCDEDASPSPGL